MATASQKESLLELVAWAMLTPAREVITPLRELVPPVLEVVPPVRVAWALLTPARELVTPPRELVPPVLEVVPPVRVAWALLAPAQELAPPVLAPPRLQAVCWARLLLQWTLFLKCGTILARLFYPYVAVWHKKL